MSWVVTVTEVEPGVEDRPAKEIERYQQTIDHMDLLRLIEVVNAKPPRVRKKTNNEAAKK